MFLLPSLNNRKLSNGSKVDFFRTLKNKTFILKKKQKLSRLNFMKNRAFVKQELISYIVNIVITKKNSLIYVTNIKGGLEYFQSISSLNTTGKQKTKQPAALLKLLKFFISNANFLKKEPIILHFKNVNRRLFILLTKILENVLYIKSIRTYNFLVPHNGCRPKKIKRKKNRKIMFK